MLLLPLLLEKIKRLHSNFRKLWWGIVNKIQMLVCNLVLVNILHYSQLTFAQVNYSLTEGCNFVVALLHAFFLLCLSL